MKFTRPSNFLLIIFMFNINISFAEMPNYTCFMFSKKTKKSRYKVTGAIAETFRTTPGFMHKPIDRDGWFMPYYKPFRIIDTKSGNASEFTVDMSYAYMKKSCQETGEGCKSSSGCQRYCRYIREPAGYITNTKPVTKKGVNVQGCTDAKGTDYIRVKGGKCCILKIIP